MNFTLKTDCSDCPCRSTDYEKGSVCNLDYKTDLEWTKEKKLIYCSDNCELELVKFKGGEFKPTEKKKVIDLHPSDWCA